MGKKSNNSKKRKGSGKAVQNRFSSSCPPLPAEIFGVIAEHLIGQFAFGTVASLNVTSKSVHDETLPILYETLLLERFDELPHYRDSGSLPSGLKYTRFAVVYAGNKRKDEIAGAFRQIVLTIQLDDEWHTNDHNLCSFTVQRPISTSTLYSILQTPLRHLVRQHETCEIGQALMTGMFEKMGLAPKGSMGQFAAAAQRAPISDKRRPMVYACAQERMKPPVRPVEGIRDVFFMKGAYIKRDPTTIHPRLFSLSDAHIRFIDIHQSRPSRVARSVLEILKSTGAQDYASHFGTEEVALRRHRVRDQVLGGATCMYARSYSPWHVRLSLNRRSLEAFAKLLEREVKACPGILRNRMYIKIEDEAPEKELRSILDHLLRVYQEHITSTSQILPWYRIDPHVMLRIDAKGPCAPQAGKDTTVAHKADLWIGCIEVLERGRQRAEFAVKIAKKPASE